MGTSDVRMSKKTNIHEYKCYLFYKQTYTALQKAYISGSKQHNSEYILNCVSLNLNIDCDAYVSLDKFKITQHFVFEHILAVSLSF